MYANSKVDKLVARIKRQNVFPKTVVYANSERRAEIELGDVSIQCEYNGKDYFIVGYWDEKEQSMFIFAETNTPTAAANAFVDCVRLHRAKSYKAA